MSQAWKIPSLGASEAVTYLHFLARVWSSALAAVRGGLLFAWRGKEGDREKRI